MGRVVDSSGILLALHCSFSDVQHPLLSQIMQEMVSSTLALLSDLSHIQGDFSQLLDKELVLWPKKKPQEIL